MVFFALTACADGAIESPAATPSPAGTEDASSSTLPTLPLPDVKATIDAAVSATLTAVSLTAMPTLSPSLERGHTSTPMTVPTPTAARLPEPTFTPEPTLDPGAWEKFTYTDNLTGESETGVGLAAVWSSETSSFFKNDPARFNLACRRDGYLVGSLVWPGAYIVGDLLKTITDDDNNLPIEYLLDGVSYTDWWRTSGNDEFVVIPPDELPVFLNRVSVASTLGIQVMATGWGDNGQQARFEVMGLAWALEQLPCSVPSSPAPSPTPTQRPLQPSSTPMAPKTPTSTPTPRPTPTLSPIPTPDPGGGWKTFTYEDNLTGQVHTGVRLDAVWSTGTFSLVEEEPARFVLKCHHDSGLYGYFEWPGTAFLFGDPFKGDKLPVEYVVDDVRYTGWWTGSDGGSIGIAPEDLQVFLDRVRSAEALGIQFLETEWVDNEEQARFEVPGIVWGFEPVALFGPAFDVDLGRGKTKPGQGRST